MITATTLVLAVVSMIVADNSRMTPMKTKHQVATTLARNNGAVICHKDFSRVAPKIRLASSSSGWSPRNAAYNCW